MHLEVLMLCWCAIWRNNCLCCHARYDVVVALWSVVLIYSLVQTLMFPTSRAAENMTKVHVRQKLWATISNTMICHVIASRGVLGWSRRPPRAVWREDCGDRLLGGVVRTLQDHDAVFWGKLVQGGCLKSDLKNLLCI